MPNFFDHFAVNSSKRTCNNGLGLLSLNASGLNIFYLRKVNKGVILTGHSKNLTPGIHFLKNFCSKSTRDLDIFFSKIYSKVEIDCLILKRNWGPFGQKLKKICQL